MQKMLFNAYRAVFTNQFIQSHITRIRHITNITSHLLFGVTPNLKLLDKDIPKEIPQYYDAATWDTRWTANDIQLQLQRNLLNPHNAPNYNSLYELLKLGDTEAIQRILNVFVEFPTPKKITAGKFIEEHLKFVTNSTIKNSHTSSISTANIILDIIKRGLSSHPGCGERNIVVFNTVSQESTYQTVNDFLNTLHGANETSRLIICCGHSPEVMNFVNQVRDAGSTSEIVDALCEFIRMRVQTITGIPQDPSNYRDPRTAYATWESETAHFQVRGDKIGAKALLVLVLDDLWEELAKRPHPSLVHKSSGKPYTLLEALCLAVPSPYSIFVIGLNAKINSTDPTFLSLANVTIVLSRAAAGGYAC